jgi:glycine cleavage system aminomethyltransferase T
MAKQSALQNWAEQAGGIFTAHHGWQTPARFQDPQKETLQVAETAGLADVSWMVKLDLKGRGVDTLPALSEGVRSWPLGLRHVLVTCDPKHRHDASAQCTAAPGVFVTDVTSVFSQFLLAGPCARQILAKLSSLNVSEYTCAQTTLAHVHATILRQDLRQLPAFHLLVARDYGESVWEAVLHAGHEFHLVPFGLETLGALGG